MAKEILVHVIRPDGVRFQHAFRAGTKDADILRQLQLVKHTFGYAGTVTKKDKVFGLETEHADPSSGWAWDHKDCVVAVGEPNEDGTEFNETRRIKGPPKKEENKEGGDEPPTPDRSEA